jgi:ferredoxin
MAKFTVDAALCSGHGMCESVAPAVYSLDADGFNMAVGIEQEIPLGLETDAHDGADLCPDQAIRILG